MGSNCCTCAGRMKPQDLTATPGSVCTQWFDSGLSYENSDYISELEPGTNINQIKEEEPLR